jgi:CheY-like chemotaxis protein
VTNTRKILIVDDDSELREALVEQLELHEEFESIAVDNGTKGVQTAKAGQIDLVIMDVGLPIDGPIGHSLLEMFEHAGLSSRHADRQGLAVRHPKFDDIRAVDLRAVDHERFLPVTIVSCCPILPPLHA